MEFKQPIWNGFTIPTEGYILGIVNWCIILIVLVITVSIPTAGLFLGCILLVIGRAINFFINFLIPFILGLSCPAFFLSNTCLKLDIM